MHQHMSNMIHNPSWGRGGGTNKKEERVRGGERKREGRGDEGRRMGGGGERASGGGREMEG